MHESKLISGRKDAVVEPFHITLIEAVVSLLFLLYPQRVQLSVASKKIS